MEAPAAAAAYAAPRCNFPRRRGLTGSSVEGLSFEVDIVGVVDRFSLAAARVVASFDAGVGTAVAERFPLAAAGGGEAAESWGDAGRGVIFSFLTRWGRFFVTKKKKKKKKKKISP